MSIAVVVNTYSTADRQQFEQSNREYIVESRLKFLVGLAGLEGVRVGHACPPAGDLQLSDSLRHGFSTILLFKRMLVNFLNFCRATSLSGIAVMGKKGKVERGSRPYEVGLSR